MGEARSESAVEISVPRGRWFARLAAALLVLVVAAMSLRLVAGFVVGRRHAAAIAELERDGLATRLADVEQPAVPDAQNAALLWQQAFAARGAVDSPRGSTIAWSVSGEFPPYTAKWQQMADASEIADANAFGMADRARRLTRADWGISLAPSTAVRQSLSALSGARTLAERLADSFENRHLHGDDDVAMDRLFALLALGDAVREQPTLLAYLVGGGIDAVTCSAIRPNVGSLRFTPEQGRRAIEALLADQQPVLARALNTDVAYVVEDPSNGFGVSSAWLSAPAIARVFDERVAYTAAAARVGRSLDAHAALFRSRNAAAAAWDGSSSHQSVDALGRLRDTFDINRGGLAAGRVFQTSALLLATRQVAAVALAVRWYQLEHAGQFPGTLDALVPRYLPAVPLNPLSVAGAPYEYALQRGTLPDGGDRPLLFVEMPDGKRGKVSLLPVYEITFTDVLPGTSDRNNGRVSDLTSWTPTPAMIRSARRF